MAAEPSPSVADLAELLLGQLRFLRQTLLDKLDGLPEDDLRGSRLPSGWSPLELLRHLVHVERRWVVWGFLGVQVPDPWGDDDPATGHWVLAPEDTLAGLEAALTAGAARTEEVVADHWLSDRGRLGGRFEDGAPTLGWILLHLVQEFARHVGHLDIARELVDGSVGE